MLSKILDIIKPSRRIVTCEIVGTEFRSRRLPHETLDEYLDRHDREAAVHFAQFN